MPISLSGAPLTQDDLRTVSTRALNVVGSPPIGFGTEFTVHTPGGPPRYFASPPPFLYPPAGYLTTGQAPPDQDQLTMGPNPLTIISVFMGGGILLVTGIWVLKLWQLAATHRKTWWEASTKMFKRLLLWALWSLSIFVLGAFVGARRLFGLFGQ